MWKSLAAAAALVFALPSFAADLVLVVGGTGKTGWETVQAAKAAGYAVRATTTNVERATERYGDDGFDWVKMDARVLDDVRTAMAGVDYVISTLGGSCFNPGGPNSPQHVDYQGVVNMAGVARTVGVKQFVLTSSIGAGVSGQALNQFCDNVLMWKWLGEEYLRDGELPYTIVRPGGLGTDPGGQQGVKIAADGALDGGFIQRADVASVLVAALKNEDALGKTLEIVGDPEADPDDWRDDFAAIDPDPPQRPPLQPGQFE